MNTAIEEFERYLKRRFPGSTTARHYHVMFSGANDAE
jgi:hypothetical protein